MGPFLNIWICRFLEHLIIFHVFSGLHGKTGSLVLVFMSTSRLSGGCSGETIHYDEDDDDQDVDEDGIEDEDDDHDGDEDSNTPLHLGVGWF